MGIKRKFIKEATKTLLQMDPTLPKEQVKDVLEHIWKSRLSDPTIIMDNNVTGDGAMITLTKLCNWIDDKQPVVSGNATFYCQPSVLLSPTSNMLRSLKKGRKAVKKQMFKFKAGSDEYDALDLDQGNKKVIMNAEYGGSGTPTAAFYTKYSPAATTLMAQSIITTMAAFFEGFIGDRQIFFNINECFDWMNIVITKTEKIPKWIKRPYWKEVSDRIKKHLYTAYSKHFPAIEAYIQNCTSDQLVYLYYANNLNQFIQDHPPIQLLLSNILTKLPSYEAAINDIPHEFYSKFPYSEDGSHIESFNRWMSKEMFLNPYDIPDIIKDDMDQFVTIVNQFVFVEYITPDSIVKLNNHKRNTVLLVDTDSNIINSDIFVSYVLDVIFPGMSFNRDRMYNDMILVNILAATIDKGVAKILDYYGRCHNMDEESRAELTMKNEFMFRVLFLMLTKKRYAASIVLREGNIIIPFKPEIKGMDFIKAGVTDKVSKRFTKILCDYILYSDTIETHKLMDDLKSFEREIYQDLKNGGMEYLKQQQYKDENGYAKIKDKSGRVIGTTAWTQQPYRGSVVWNKIYPDKKIYSLDRVRILKLIVTDAKDMDIIKDKYPEKYNTVLNEIFNSESEDIRKAGLKVICIPTSVKKIPEWLIPLIDYDITVSDVMSSFASVLDALDIEYVQYKTPNGKANIPTCLISI